MHESGPYLANALICDRVLVEQDGTMSAIRIIDRVQFTTDEAGAPLRPVQPLFFFVSFRPGEARGIYTVSIRRERPSGEQDNVVETPVVFEAPERPVHIVIGAEFQPDQAGLYWYDILFDGGLVTRMPLRAVFLAPPRFGL